jgi:hypothetical protein
MKEREGQALSPPLLPPTIEDGRAASQVIVLMKHLAIFFLFPSKKFLSISFQIQQLETFPQKQKEQRQKQLYVSFF